MEGYDSLRRELGVPAEEPATGWALSPSLRRNTATGSTAYETKFLLSEHAAQDLESFLEGQIQPDPHASPVEGSSWGEYDVTTLYTDTPTGDVFHRRKPHHSNKLRLRHYGASDRNPSDVYLEKKSRRGERVSKRRARLDFEQLIQLEHPASDRLGESSWFATEIDRWQLRPRCLIAYRRRAGFAVVPEGVVRITLDRQLRAAAADRWSTVSREPLREISLPGVICEFKYADALPELLKSAIARFDLAPTGFSKYRWCAGLLACVPPREESSL